VGVGASSAQEAGADNNLVFQGGSVLHTTHTYAIFWRPQFGCVNTGIFGVVCQQYHYEFLPFLGPPGTDAVDSRFEGIETRFLQDVGGSSYYGILSQYSDGNGPILDESTFSGSWEDNTQYPHVGSSSDPLTDADIRDSIIRAIQANNWPVDNSVFLVYTAFATQECGPPSVPNMGCSAQGFAGNYCGYHYSFNYNGHDIVYAFMDDVAGAALSCGAVGHNPSGNGDFAADQEVSITAHELFEATTDPYSNGWFDSSGNEIGDKCYTDFPNTTSSLSGNLNLNGHEYIVQSMWSKADNKCVMGYNPPPIVSGISPSSVQAGGSTDVTVRVSGHDFMSDSTVQLNGTNLSTTYDSAQQLTAVIPHGMLATPSTDDITVVTGGPGGGTSTAQPLFVTLTNASVSAFNVATGTNPQAQLTNLTATGTGTGTLVVAKYGSNPGGTPTFSTAVSADRFFDVHAASGNSFTSVNIVDCDLNGGSQAWWYDASGQAWTPASEQSYDPTTGCTTITVDNTTQPSLTQLAGVPLGIANVPPTWVPTADQTQDYHDLLSFTLKSTDPEPGDQLTLTHGTLPAGLSLTDNGNRTWTVSGTLQAAAGNYPVTFDVTDGANPPVSETVTIHVAHEETTLTYTGSALIANNRPATLSAILKEDGTSAPAPAGQMVTLTLGSASPQSCQGQTQADGRVSCEIASVNQPLGTEAVSAYFAGDGYYSASSDRSQKRLVFSYLPGGGGFAVGDQSVVSSNAVTWWSAQWAKVNNLSGGSAPAAFKGFAHSESPAGDPTCGRTWSTGPGASSAPPASVPSYMAVVVPTRVSKSGSAISGDVSKIVIVRTGSGYGPDPGKTGTGTVVATLCHN
jgi:hypothetical protein